MSRAARVWMVVAALYAAFFAWYTSFGGPLTADEIDRYVAVFAQRGGAPEDVARIRAFLEADSGDDFAMVNVIEMREPPTRVAGVGADESAADVLGRYMAFMWPELLRRACHPVLMGTAAAPALDVWGIEGGAHWDQAGVMRYRSRRDLMEIATNPAFEGPHEFKVAAMTKTITFPIDPWFHLGDPRLVVALVLLVVGLIVARTDRSGTRLGT